MRPNLPTMAGLFRSADKVEGAKPVNAGISGLIVNVVVTLST